MPNWCTNRVNVFSENKKDLQKVYDIFADEKSVFGKVIPEPEWDKIPVDGEYPKKVEMKNPNGEVFAIVSEWSNGRQDDRWYDWRNQNWGTKWDCYEVEIDDSEMPYGFEVTFDTAWSPPEEIHSAIQEQFDDLSMSWFWDEPGCEEAGYL